MTARQPATSRETRIVGAAAAAFGFWLVLVGLGVLPVPGGPRNLHGPLWMVLAAGLAFFLAGLAIVLQMWGRADSGGELPADAPAWMVAAQYLLCVAIFLCFAMSAEYSDSALN